MYPLLISLYCQVNQINEIKDHSVLTHLTCMYNQIRSIGKLPNLQSLLACNNLITQINNDYSNIHSIDISNNQIHR